MDITSIQLNSSNASPLFKTVKGGLAVFDRKGFFMSDEAKVEYARVKNEPHLYAAYKVGGAMYIGKSFQRGGRWRRLHAYHLGTLAHELLDTTRVYDKRHGHWVDAWMHRSKMTQITDDLYTIPLRGRIVIEFIPFKAYAGVDFHTLSTRNIRKINSVAEKILIRRYNHNLLNIIV
jgi:hypothetical protein